MENEGWKYEKGPMYDDSQSEEEERYGKRDWDDEDFKDYYGGSDDWEDAYEDDAWD